MGHTALARAFARVMGAFALASSVGCSPASTPSDGSASDASVREGGGAACIQSCEQDPSQQAARYCGTDHRTYTYCQWVCDEVASGVGVFPGACQDDGSPQPGGPPEPADGVSICDWFSIDGAWVAGECEEAIDSSMMSGTGGTDLGGAREFESMSATLPTEVDHRRRFGSVKSQGSAPTCIAFAATAGLEGAVRVVANERVSLSEMHLFARYRTTRYGDMINAIRSGATATSASAEAAGLPYSEAVARSWLANRATPDSALIAQLDRDALFAVGSVYRIERETGAARVSAAQLQRAIADGSDVIVGFRMSDNWYARNMQPGQGGVIEEYSNGRNFGHAVLLVGYRQLDGRSYFILRNSWGTSWGDGGYGYISFETAEANLQVAVVVAARERRAQAAVDCPAGEAAALDGTCRRTCPDGSIADSAGACPAANGMCPDGQTPDSSETCVRACSTGNFTVDGAEAQCGPRGCTWVIQSGRFGCTAPEGQTCEQHCPAPNCEATESGNEFNVRVVGCGPGQS